MLPIQLNKKLQSKCVSCLFARAYSIRLLKIQSAMVISVQRSANSQSSISFFPSFLLCSFRCSLICYSFSPIPRSSSERFPILASVLYLTLLHKQRIQRLSRQTQSVSSPDEHFSTFPLSVDPRYIQVPLNSFSLLHIVLKKPCQNNRLLEKHRLMLNAMFNYLCFQMTRFAH